MRRILLVALATWGGCSSEAKQAGAQKTPGATAEQAKPSPCPPGAKLVVEETRGGPEVSSCRKPDGTFHGRYQVTWPGGVVAAEGQYQGGLEVGRWIFRHATGAVWKQGEYRGGLAHGTWTVSDPEGKALGSYQMDRGSGTEVRWWMNAQKRETIEKRRGVPDGVARRWLETGERVEELHYREGKLHGTWTFWDRQGRTRKIEKWSQGILGPTTWYENGVPLTAN